MVDFQFCNKRFVTTSDFNTKNNLFDRMRKSFQGFICSHFSQIFLILYKETIKEEQTFTLNIANFFGNDDINEYDAKEM